MSKFELDLAWDDPDQSNYKIGNREYFMDKVWKEADKLEPFLIPMSGLFIDYVAPCHNNLHDFARHCLQVQQADLSYPIILNEDGHVIDGKHRMVKALVEKQESILAVRFRVDPESCYTDLEEEEE